MVFNWIVNQLKTYDNKVNSVFSDNKILKEKIHHSCIAAIYINSVLKLNKKISSSLAKHKFN